MHNFQHLATPLRLFHGADSLTYLPRELERLGLNRAVIFCGSTLSNSSSMLDRVTSQIKTLCVGTFGGVKSHSPLPVVEAGAEMLRSLKADSIIAVGGGSAVVTARAATILLAESQPIARLCTVRRFDGTLQSPKLLAPKLPQFIVPTLPSTAIVKAGSAVFDPTTGERLALFDPKTRVQSLFLDPLLMTSSPSRFLISAGLNTLTAACEGLMSRSGDPISDAHLVQALKLIASNLPNPSRHGEDEVRSALMLSAILCGRGTEHTGAGVATALGHAIAGRHHLENGIINAILLPHAVHFNSVEGQAGISKIANVFELKEKTGETAEYVARALQQILSNLSVPSRLRDCNIPQAALVEISKGAMDDWFIRSNPRHVQSSSELLKLLELAW